MLDVIRDEDLMENAAQMGALLRDGIAGLYLGVEIVSGPAARTASGSLATRVVDALRRAGVLVDLCGVRGDVVEVGPSVPARPSSSWTGSTACCGASLGEDGPVSVGHVRDPIWGDPFRHPPLDPGPSRPVPSKR